MIKNKKILISLSIFIIVLAAVGSLERTNIANLLTPKKTSTTVPVRTTSKVPSAQSNYKSGNVRQPGNTLNEYAGSGTISDNSGNTPSNVNTSNPIVSKTGEITVYTPQPNSVVSQGAELNGTSTLSKVSYRIIDDLTGQIASGELQVVNGKFSGQISYSTSAPTGRIDIFGTRDDGVEFSNIEIPVRFK